MKEAKVNYPITSDLLNCMIGTTPQQDRPWKITYTDGGLEVVGDLDCHTMGFREPLEENRAGNLTIAELLKVVQQKVINGEE